LVDVNTSHTPERSNGLIIVIILWSQTEHILIIDILLLFHTQVPEEAAPLVRASVEAEKTKVEMLKVEKWPGGWHPQEDGIHRRVECEKDIFDLLGLPYREPHERDCPN
jgi:hypothetical protein